jgi:hypothetical protein
MERQPADEFEILSRDENQHAAEMTALERQLHDKRVAFDAGECA